MFGDRRLSLAGLLLLIPLPLLNAQVAKDPAPPSAQKSTAASVKAANNEAAERAAKERRSAALSLLATLSDDARKFHDERLRARTLARIGDALWDADADQGRLLFHKAWDAAEIADQESARRTEEDRRQQQAGKSGVALTLPPDLRSEVLRLAAKRDRALGEELLDKLKETRKQEADDAAASARQSDPFNTPAATRQRLNLASQLLESDVTRAMQFADPALQAVTLEGLNFLSSLRDKNAAAADQRFARLLAIAGADLQADANTVSLLSSYLFSPHVFVTFLASGGQQTSRWNQGGGPPDVSPDLQAAYLRLAAQILLRPLPPPQDDHSTSGIQGKYLVIKRLMPVFEQYESKEIVEQLHGELAALGQGSDQNARDDEIDSLRQGIAPERKAEDREQSLLDRIERAKTSAERDALYLQLAIRTAEKGDLRARDFVEKIDDTELRKQVKPYVDVTLAMQVVEKKDVEKALIVARQGELSHIQRVWVLARAAKLMPSSDRKKALEIIGEALEEARRIDGSDPDRPRALVAVANAFAATERERAWETMLDASKAANSAEGFTGEDGRLVIRLQTPTQASLRTSTVDDFDLQGIFRLLTVENYTQAIQLGRDFEGEAPRATAIISIARTILNEKQK
jgi:hypothetical protein